MGKGNRTRQEAKNAAKAGGTKLWVKITGWAVGIVFLLLLAVSLLHTTGVLQRAVTTISVGNEKVSALDYNIYYMYSRNAWLNASDNGYGVPNYYLLQMYGYTVDATLDEMDNGEGGTWRDSFNDVTVQNVHSILSLYQAGKDAGHVMNADADLTQEQIATFAEAAETYDTTLQGYITSYYGNNTKENDIRRVYDIISFANSYSNAIQQSYGFGETDVEAYYQENRDSYDRADYYSYAFPYTTYTYSEPAEGEEPAQGAPTSEEEATAMTEASKAEAKTEADAFLARLNAGEAFDDIALALFEAEEATHTHDEEEEAHAFTSALTENAALTGTGNLITWVKDMARTAGDTEVIDTGNGYTVTRFEDRYRDRTRTATARHILFPVTTELSDEPTESEQAIYDTEMDLLQNKAQTVMVDWMNGEATEEAFAELAKELSSDGNAQQGGIYEHFYEGAMVETFNNWVFDETRQYGDTGIVQTEYGVHLIYFVSFDRDNYYYTIENTLINQRFATELEALMASYALTTNRMGMNLSF